MKLYCQECGSPIQYSGKRPNFCPSCGTGLSKSSPKPSIQNKAREETVEDEDLDGEFHTNIDKLQFEILMPESDKGVKFGDALGSSKQEIEKEFSRPKSKKESKKKIKENLQKEGGALRPKKRASRKTKGR